MEKSLRYDWGECQKAIDKFEQYLNDGKKVRFVISEHDYSAGYWIEDKEREFKPNNTDVDFYDVKSLKKYCEDNGYLLLQS